MKRKPKRRKYACLKKRKSIAKILKILKTKWPTIEETLAIMHQKYTHKEYEDLFRCHYIHPPEDNLNYSLAKSERDHMDKMGESFVKFMSEQGEDETQEKK